MVVIYNGIEYFDTSRIMMGGCDESMIRWDNDSSLWFQVGDLLLVLVQAALCRLNKTDTLSGLYH